MAEPGDKDTVRSGGRIWQWVKRRLKVLVLEVGLVVLVLFILVLIGGIVIHPDPFEPSPGERVRRVMREGLDKIVNAAVDSHNQEGHFPESLEELIRWHGRDGPLSSEEQIPPHDPYGIEWRYEVRGDRIKVYSYGGDDLPGGEGPGEDMVVEATARLPE